jgi:hypothetical protein
MEVSEACSLHFCSVHLNYLHETYRGDLLSTFLRHVSYFASEYATDARLIYFNNTLLREVREIMIIIYCFQINKQEQTDVHHNLCVVKCEYVTGETEATNSSVT